MRLTLPFPHHRPERPEPVLFFRAHSYRSPQMRHKIRLPVPSFWGLPHLSGHPDCLVRLPLPEWKCLRSALNPSVHPPPALPWPLLRQSRIPVSQNRLLWKMWRRTGLPVPCHPRRALLPSRWPPAAWLLRRPVYT